MPFVDSQHLFSTLDFFTLDSRHFYSRLSTFLLSTLDFYSRLSTITLDSRHLLSTLDPRLLDTLLVSITEYSVSPITERTSTFCEINANLA